MEGKGAQACRLLRESTSTLYMLAAHGLEGRPGSCYAALPHRPAVEPSWRVATRQGGSLDVGMRFITIFLRKTLLGVSRSVGRLWIASFYMLYLCRKNLE